ncbi:MAG: hypothetical protein PHY18_03235 [Dehalococcoidales bacterium]|nr:hypothetical protein [Dehalococcoidales bacterium]
MKIKNRVKWRLLISLLATAMLVAIIGSGFLTPIKMAFAVEAAPSDAQEATIIKVLTEAGAALGWHVGDCRDHTNPVEGATPIRKCTHIDGPLQLHEQQGDAWVDVPGATYRLMVPYIAEGWLFEDVPLAIFAYPTEAAARTAIDRTIAQATNLTSYGFAVTIFHGRQAVTMGEPVASVNWQSGRFQFEALPASQLSTTAYDAAEALYASAVRNGLIAGDGGTGLIPDSDSDGIADDIDQCPGTPAGTSVDASGCPVGLSVTIATDKTDYLPGETALIQGNVSDGGSPVSGASVTVDVGGWKGSANTDASGNYRVEYFIPADIGQLSYVATAMASHGDKTGASSSFTFSVGQVGLIVAMTTDKYHYLIGDTVYCTITVKDAQDQPVSDANLQITAKRLDSGRTTNLSYTTNALGENQWSFTWGQDDSGRAIVEGKLQIDIIASKDDVQGRTTITLCGCGDLEKTDEEDCIDCPEDCQCEPDKVCDPSSRLKDPQTMCGPKMAYIFISDGLSAYHRWWASDDIRYARKLFLALGYQVEPDITVGHISDIAKYLSRPSTKAIAYFGHGEEPGGIPTIEAAEATSGGYSIKTAITTASKQDGGFLSICQYNTYAAKWVDNQDKLEKMAQGQADHPNLENAFIFACYSLDSYSLRDYLLESGGAFWGYQGKLPGSAYLTKTYKP